MMMMSLPAIPPRSHLVEDFSDRATGSLVGQGWSSIGSSTNVNWTVALDGASLSGKSVLVDKTTSDAIRRISFDLAGSIADVEVLARFRLLNAPVQLMAQINVRADTSPGGYFSGFENFGGLKHTLFEIVDASNTTELDNEAFSTTTGVWYWRRLRINGTTITGKAWEDGDPEPSSFGLSASDATFSSGLVGLGAYDDALNYICDYFSVGIGGASAPGPAG